VDRRCERSGQGETHTEREGRRRPSLVRPLDLSGQTAFLHISLASGMQCVGKISHAKMGPPMKQQQLDQLGHLTLRHTMKKEINPRVRRLLLPGAMSRGDPFFFLSFLASPPPPPPSWCESPSGRACRKNQPSQIIG